MNRRHTICALLGGALGGAGCLRRDRPELTVGARAETEHLILAEIFIAWLKRTLDDPEIVRRFGLGGSTLLLEAMQSGQVDLCPEYSGAALRSHEKFDSTADRRLILQRLKASYREQYQAEWVGPLGFENRHVVVLRRDKAESLGVRSLSDAAGISKGWLLGADREFIRRNDCLPALLSHYRLILRGSEQVLEPSQRYVALEEGTVDMLIGLATDASLEQQKFIAIEDNDRVLLPFEAGMAVRIETMERIPQLTAMVNRLVGKVSFDQMRLLNRQVEVQGQPPEKAAADFIRQLG